MCYQFGGLIFGGGYFPNFTVFAISLAFKDCFKSFLFCFLFKINCFLTGRLHGDEGGYLGRVVSVKDDVVEYREWVESAWAQYSTPLITQVSCPSVPTYASIANRHAQPVNVIKTQGVTLQDVSNRSATWPSCRSQSNMETAVLETRMAMQREWQQSTDCLYTSTGGIKTKPSTNSVWTATSVRKLADSLAQDNVARQKGGNEMRTADSIRITKPSSYSKPSPTNSYQTTLSSEVNSYSAVTKHSRTATLKENLHTSTKTSVVNLKAKSVLDSGATSTKTSAVAPSSKSKAVSGSGQMSTNNFFAIDSMFNSKSVSSGSGNALTKVPLVDLTSKSKAVKVLKVPENDLASKPKSVSTSGPVSGGPHKKTEERKTPASNNNVSGNHSTQRLSF